MKQSLIFCSVLILSAAPHSWSQVPHLLNYQGHLAAGDTALTGTFTMVFSIYKTPDAGSPLWTERQSVKVADGLFNVLLGSVEPVPLSLFGEAERYLGVKVGERAELVPRQRIVSVSYALRAEVADDVKGREISPASVSIEGAGPAIDRQGRWIGGDVRARAVTADSVEVPGRGGVIDRQGRWVGGDVRAGLVTTDSVVVPGKGAVIDGQGRWVGGQVRASAVTADSVEVPGRGGVIDRQGRWVGPPQPARQTYLTVGPKGTAVSPIPIVGNQWRDIEDFALRVSVEAPSVLDIRFDGLLSAGSNCMLRLRVDGKAPAGNVSGVENTLTGGRRHLSAGITAIERVSAGEHIVILQGIVESSADGQFLSGQLTNGLVTVRVYGE